jgi:hypothetical protein
MASKRRGGRASAKRQATARRAAKRRAANKAKANQIAERNRDFARSGGNRGPDVRSEGMTGRDKGIMAASTKTRNSKIKDLQQSVGSLDRRVEKALADGNTDLAKDLRSRQNKFVKELGYQRALNTGGGTIRGNIRTSDGKVPLTSKGFDVFQNTVDQDFIDPTRKLQNLYPDDFGRMYPITNVINKGPFAFRGIQAALGKERKQIPYNLEDMPGVRYPLDQGPFFGGRSRDPNFDSYPYAAPLEPVTITDLEDDLSTDFSQTRDTLEDLGIDENQILPVQDDPNTDIIEKDSNDGSAIQQYYRQIEENKKNFPEFLTNRSPFFLPEDKKAELNEQAANALEAGSDRTYKMQFSDDDLANIGINRATFESDYDTPLVQKAINDYLEQQALISINEDTPAYGQGFEEPLEGAFNTQDQNLPPQFETAELNKAQKNLINNRNTQFAIKEGLITPAQLFEQLKVYDKKPGFFSKGNQVNFEEDVAPLFSIG